MAHPELVLFQALLKRRPVPADLTSMATSSRPAGPSRWWIVVAAATATLSIAAGIGALVYQRNASRPIGEGELFLDEARTGLARIRSELAAGATPDQAVRRLRNSMEIEAVALLDQEGAVRAATSETLHGTTVTNPVLARALESRRFGAVAAPLSQDIEVDGVREWARGEALYLAFLPGGDDSNLLLYYDISELVERRSRTDGIQTETIQLAVVSFLLAVAVVTTLIGRWRSLQRYREMDLQAQFLRKESEALQMYNAELEVARAEAEKALALAEEKNRIRSEFVLMINHELRTPLTSVVTGAELLACSDRLDADERHIVDSLVHDGRRLQEMIDQLLALARVENRGLAFIPRRVALSEVCEAATSSHHRAIHREVTEHTAEANVEVETDLQTITQLVASLVDNAYTHGAHNVQVECSVDPRRDPQLVVGETPENFASISVIDDGPGIRPGFLPQAFEKFEKDSRSSGTGLGLYMARLMAEAIGAALHVWTSPAGTTISVVVPLAEVRTKVGAA